MTLLQLSQTFLLAPGMRQIDIAGTMPASIEVRGRRGDGRCSDRD